MILLRAATALFLIPLLLAAGCSSGLQPKSQPPQAKTPLPSDLSLAAQVKETVERRAVDQAVAVVLKKTSPSPSKFRVSTA